MTADAVVPGRENVPHVLLISVDALRADQPWSGYSLASTPRLNQLAERSVVYNRVYSLANHTTPSLAGLLSGRYPSELKRDRCALTKYHIEQGLASVLSEAGVRTFAAHGHAIFASNMKPSVGFQEWKVLDRAASMRITEGGITGEDIAALLIAFLRRQAAEPQQRFFAWAHFVDPHDAYVRHAHFPPSSHPHRGVYDGEVAYEDHIIGSVLDVLHETGLDTSTAVILTADHGESFGEHGYFRHGFSLYDEEVRIPLILSIPGVAPRRIEAVRSAIDFAPTIASLYGISPPNGWRGQSLLTDLTGPVTDRHAIVDSPELDSRRAMQAVILPTIKVWLDGRVGRVWDLAADPKEHVEIKGSAAQSHIDTARNLFSVIEPAPSTPCGLIKK